MTWTIETLDQALTISDGALSLTADTLPGTPLAGILTNYNNGSALSITGAVKQVGSDGISVSGNMAFMNAATALATTAVFTIQADGSLRFQIHCSLIGADRGPSPWNFQTSFPSLPKFTNYTASNPCVPNYELLPSLQLSNASFILSSHAGTDSAGNTPLAAGLNFVGTLQPSGLLGLFDELAGVSAEVTLYGSIIMPDTGQAVDPLPDRTYPWQLPTEVPGILLQAKLGFSLTLGNLSYANCTLHIYSPLTTDWQKSNSSYQPTLAISGALSVPSGGISSELTALIIAGSNNAILSGNLQNVSLNNLAQLSDLSNGGDLFSSLPQQFQAFGQTLGGIELQGIGISMSSSLTPTAIDYAYLMVGLSKVTWDIYPGWLSVGDFYADFMVAEPFGNRSVSALLRGKMTVAGALFDINFDYPNFTARAKLSGNAVLPLPALFAESFPSLPAPPELDINDIDLSVTPGKSYHLAASMADSPGWTIDLGPIPMTLQDIRLDLNATTSVSVQGSFSGSIDFGSSLNLSMQYDIPGEFRINAHFPEVSLSQLIKRLNNIGIALPSGFDLSFQDTYVLIEGEPNVLKFTAATKVENFGLLAFTAQRQGSQWGFAAGMRMDIGGLSDIPGLEGLAPFESFIGLQQLMMVVSSMEVPDFQFPATSSFKTPSLGQQNIKLPAQSSGLVQGLNFYAKLSGSANKGFSSLAKYLGVDLTGSAGITLSVSLPAPTTNSKLFLSVQAELQQGTILAGQLGGLLQTGMVGAFLTGKVDTVVQNQKMQFDVTALVVENGVFISGSMQGTLRFEPVQLSNLGLVIGLNFEGIPSLGIAATLDVSEFDSSVAVFFDSANPTRSMVAGSVSNLTLLDVCMTIAGQQNVPSELSPVLGGIGLNGLKALTLSAALADALNNLDIATVSQAFQAQGITIPGIAKQVLLIVSTPGSQWYLTDLTKMQHYALSLSGGSIQVELQPQFYCAPQATSIGALQFPQGLFIVTEIDFLVIQEQIQVNVRPSEGIAVYLETRPIVIYRTGFFALTGAGGNGGPVLSLSTYSQPSQTDPQLRAPHFLFSGEIQLLGSTLSNAYALIGSSGIQFDWRGQLGPATSGNLHGRFSDLNHFSGGGDLLVGIDNSLDLGELGTIKVNVNVDAGVDFGYNSGSASASVQGSFNFIGNTVQIPKLTLDVNGPALGDLAATLWNEIEAIVRNLAASSTQWLEWIKNNVVSGAGQTAQEVGQVLSGYYRQSAQDIAKETQTILGYGADGIADALAGANVAAQEAATILNGMGYAVNVIENAISGAFGGIHVDFSIGHIDVPASPHVDTPQAPHVDTPGAPHGDVAAQHVDASKWGVHIDRHVTPHIDTPLYPHIDTPAYPHVDTPLTPHADTGTHIDT